jgi:hypothetical protein
VSTNITDRVGEWVHITGKLNSALMSIFVDGVKKQEIPTPYTPNLNDIKISIGTQFSSYPFDGYIDDIQIYATALSDSDILDLYQTRAKIDNQGNLYANEIVEDYEIQPGLTLNGLYNNNQHVYQERDIIETTSDSSGTQFLYDITTGNLRLDWTYRDYYYKHQNGDIYYKYIELYPDSQPISLGFVVLPDSSRPERENGNIGPGESYSDTYSYNYDNYEISLVEGASGQIKMKYWIVLNLTQIFGSGNEPISSEIDVYIRDYITSRPKSSGIIKTREFSEIDTPNEPMKIFKDKIQIQGSIKEG